MRTWLELHYLMNVLQPLWGRVRRFQTPHNGLHNLCRADALVLTKVPTSDGRHIGTAQKKGNIIIKGWIYPKGRTGPIALGEGVVYILLAVTQLQSNDIGVEFPPSLLVCRLTIIVDEQEVIWVEIEPSPPTTLYFIDIRMFLIDEPHEYVEQLTDYVGNEPKVYGGRGGGYTIKSLVDMPTSTRKAKPTIDMTYRVWHQHERLNHMALIIMARMARRAESS